MLQLTTIFFLIAFSVLAVVHSLAIKLFLYWKLSWFDVPMHFLGGAVVALGLYTLRDLRIVPSSLLRAIPVIGFVFLVALIWEAFEFFAGVPMEGNYYLDLVIDITMGLAGGYLGYLVGNKIRGLR